MVKHKQGESWRLIKEGRMTPAGMLAIEQAKKTGVWSAAYTNKTKDTIPVGLEDALKENLKAWCNFQNFANSYRNMYISWINSAKTDHTRKVRILKL